MKWRKEGRGEEKDGVREEKEGGEVGRDGVISLSWGRVICDNRKIQETVR